MLYLRGKTSYRHDLPGKRAGYILLTQDASMFCNIG
jgi:hypothetical protein